MRQYGAVLATLAVLGVPDVALARQGAQPWLPNPAAPPTKVAEVRPAVKRMVYVVKAGYGPRQEPKEDAKVLPYVNKEGKQVEMPFLERLYVAEGKEFAHYQAFGERRAYHLLVHDLAGRISIVGWFDTRYVIDFEARTDPDTTISEKVFLVTRPQAVEKVKDVVQEIPYYDTPEPTPATKPLGHIRLLHIHFAYGETGRGSDAYVCIGTGDTINLFNPAKTIVGWIPKVYTIPWNTRFAFDWHAPSTLSGAANRREEVAKVYRNRKDAYESLKPDSKALGYLIDEAREPAKAYPGMERSELRFPILHYRDRAEDGKEVETYPDVPDDKIRQKYPWLPNNENRLRRVAVYAGTVNAKTGKPIVGLDRKKLAELQLQLDLILKEMSTTEVVFVIDKTQSMEKSGKVVADTFKDVMATLRKGGHPVRLAMTYYRDVKTLSEDPDTAVQSSPLKDFDQALVNEIGAALLDESSYTGGGDPEELVFYGLKKAIDTAKFSPHSRKLVVLIGDCGNKKDELLGPTKLPKLKDLVDLLHPRGPKPVAGKTITPPSPIMFFALHVVKPDDGRNGTDWQKAYAAFKAEAEELVAQSQAKLNAIKGNKRSAGDYVPAVDSDLLRKAVLRCFEELENQRKDLELAIRLAKAGEVEEAISRARAGPELESMFKERLPGQTELLRKLKGEGVQLSEIGFVWDKNGAGQTQLAPCILLKKNEIQTVVQALAELPTIHGITKDGPRETLIKIGAGEYKRDEVLKLSVHELLLKKSGLPFTSKLLEKPIKEMVNDPEWETHLQIFVEKQHRLSDMLADQYRDWPAKRLTAKDNLPIPRPLGGKDGNPPPRWFHLADDPSGIWYWVDLEKEWP